MQKIDVGKNIREIRKSLGLTQEEFAKKIGLSRATVQHWEVNYTEPNLDALREMNRVFGIEYSEIIDGNL